MVVKPDFHTQLKTMIAATGKSDRALAKCLASKLGTTEEQERHWVRSIKKALPISLRRVEEVLSAIGYRIVIVKEELNVINLNLLRLPLLSTDAENDRAIELMTAKGFGVEIQNGMSSIDIRDVIKPEEFFGFLSSDLPELMAALMPPQS